jgi:hypothetical protein
MTTGPTPLETINNQVNINIKALVKYRDGTPPDPTLLQTARNLSNQDDLPVADDDIALVLMHSIEKNYAEFSEGLLKWVLIPHWIGTQSKLVESEEEEAPKDEPSYIRPAEEFLAIRYLALIRAVLINIRYLMIFVSVSFVLAIVAWNSYPFQPREIIDWIFTGLLAILGCGIIWVLAQMHRDPILSRITDKKANELGVEFYIRIFAFGAVPVLTWLTYQFPDIGSTLLKFIQPGLEVVK